MRYYKLVFSPEPGKQPPDSIKDFLEFSSIIEMPSVAKSQGPSNGFNNPGALEVEFQIEAGPIDQSIPNGSLRIYNPPKQVLDYADAYQGLNVYIYAGFNDGYTSGYKTVLEDNDVTSGSLKPLGIGKIFMSFANWMAGDWAIDMYIGAPISYTALLSKSTEAVTYSFSWMPEELNSNTGQNKPTLLSEALKACFIKTDSNGNVISTIKKITYIGNNGVKDIVTLKTNKEYAFQVTDLNKFATDFRSMTAEQFAQSKQYLDGLAMLIDGSEMFILDSNSPSVTGVLIIPESNVIGQPTISYNNNQLQIQTVHPMNSRIKPNGMGIQIDVKKDFVITNASKAANPYKSLNIQNQVLRVQKVTHMGKFRDTSYQGWVTVANTSYIPSSKITG